MSNSEDRLSWCLENEKRMRKIKSSDKLFKEHIEKGKT